MGYSAGLASKKLGLSKDTLRYYEKEGLLPAIKRDSSGHRTFSESDVEWIFLIKCLRDTDMPIFKIRKYVSLLINSCGESIPQRREILLEHEAYVKEKIASFQSLLQLIEKKTGYFDETLSSNTPDSIRCMDYATEWEHFRAKLGGIKHD